MQLMAPTPMNALRQARNASPSSERRTPGAAAINPGLFMRGQIQILPLFLAIVHLSRVNLSAVGKRPAPHPGGKQQQTPLDWRPAACRGGEKGCGAVNPPPAPALEMA